MQSFSASFALGYTTSTVILQETYPIFTNTCHMVNFVLPYDTYEPARRIDDGERTSPVARRAWMEPVQAHQERQSVLLRSQVEARSGVHRIGEQAGCCNERGGLEKDRSGVDRQNDFRPPRLAILNGGP